MPHEQEYRRRRHYRIGTEFSGLEHPRQWVTAVASVVALVALSFLIAFVAFG